MQNDRRKFIKKTAVVVGATAVVGTTSLLAKNSSYEADSSGVVVGHSSKKEILYHETKAWDEYYKQAK